MVSRFFLSLTLVWALSAGVATAKPIRVPEDTMIWFSLEQFLSSQKNRSGEEVKFSISASVKLDGQVVFRKGDRAKGVIVDASPAKGWGRSGKLSVAVKKVQAVDGSWWDIQMEPKRENKNWNAAKTIGGVALLGWAFGGGMKGKKVEFGEGTAAVGFIKRKGTINLGGASKKGPSGNEKSASGKSKTGSKCLKVCESLSGSEFSTCMNKCTGN